MENHITPSKLEWLMDKFLQENPTGDSYELALYMYNKGWESGHENL